MTDTPTDNHATINPLSSPSANTLTNGNTKFSSVAPSTFTTIQSTLTLPTTGKWYFETKRLNVGADSTTISAGIQTINSPNYTNLNSRTGR